MVVAVNIAQSTKELSTVIHGFARCTLVVSDKFFFQTDCAVLAHHIKKLESSTASNNIAQETKD
jgi:hypothetical protein